MVIVYTAITGGYDTLQATDWPSICVTDKKLKPAAGWCQTSLMAKTDPDARRASRHPKMLPHKYFASQYSLYIDGNIRLLTDPEELVEKYLKHADMALFSHPQRDCTYREASKLLGMPEKVDPAEVKKQIAFYESVGFPKNFGLTACWVILRRNTFEVQEFGEQWWEVYQAFTHRDQLSFDYVRWLTGMKYCRLPGNIFKKTSKHFKRRKHA